MYRKRRGARRSGRRQSQSKPEGGILGLHNHSDESWCVVDAKGVIVWREGLLMRMAKAVAQSAADELNRPTPFDRTPKAARVPDLPRYR